VRERIDVVVVGAGPVGLLAALVLAEHGVEVAVLEGSVEHPRFASRASTFHPPTLELLDRLGLREGLERHGRRVTSLQYRDDEWRTVAELDYALLADTTPFPYRVHAEQPVLCELIVARLRTLANVSLHFETRVVGVEPAANGVTVTARTAAGERTWTCRYQVGADGAHSTVREHSGIGFEGEEYPHRLLRVMLTTPLDELVPGLSPLTYVRGTRRSCSVLGLPDHWRLVFRVPGEQAKVDATPDAVARRLAETLPPGCEPEVQEIHPIRLSRMVASTFQRDRIVLMGDAAHLTTTAGGMNMNCGLHDAYELGTGVAAVLAGQAHPERLERLAQMRRRIVFDRVIPRTEARASRAVPVAFDPTRARRFLAEASMLDCFAGTIVSGGTFAA
jgi:2-polyprenyl-6-methoxyphenol hydroxylase-like FAD-dependent oxidoreductase